MRAAILATCLLLAAPASAAGASESSFFGVQGWSSPDQDELRTLAHAGVGSVRVGMNLASVGESGEADWRAYDQLVADAARTGIDVVPVLVFAPHVRGRQRARPPRTHAARLEWARLVGEAVERYGTEGWFWRERPELPYRPVTAWQVWNEPNLNEHWPRPSVRGYISLLSSTSRAVRAEDGQADVVLAGIPDTRRGIRLRPFLRSLYRQPGFEGLFDVIALHPYARDVAGVERGVLIARRIMRRFGDLDRRTWITEIGWATRGPTGSRFVVSAEDQAERLTDVYALFLSEREAWRLERVFWFSLRDRDLIGREPDWFGPHTGLFYRSGLAKPAWRALASVTGGLAGDWLDRFLTLPAGGDQGCGTQPSCG
jgi:hypothetical protein